MTARGNEGHPEGTATSRALLPFGLAIVRGDSMRPTLSPGDRVLVHHGRAPRRGQVVVGRFADGTTAVKRAAEQVPGGWWLLSDNPRAGVDSRHRGPVPEQDLVGVVLARLWPAPRRI